VQRETLTGTPLFASISLPLSSLNLKSYIIDTITKRLYKHTCLCLIGLDNAGANSITTYLGKEGMRNTAPSCIVGAVSIQANDSKKEVTRALQKQGNVIHQNYAQHHVTVPLLTISINDNTTTTTTNDFLLQQPKNDTILHSHHVNPNVITIKNQTGGDYPFYQSSTKTNVWSDGAIIKFIQSLLLYHDNRRIVQEGKRFDKELVLSNVGVDLVDKKRIQSRL